MNMEELFLSVEKPSRYLGSEMNALRRSRAEFRFVLAFPDTYEVGMSHLGMQILYSLLNSLPNVAAERCFAPWRDMEELLRKHRLPLVSLESRLPLHEFDMVGFSLQYELSYTNVLNMLELGGIPLRRKDRPDGSPLVIAGGPCAFNPAPMEDFIDAIVIGEGEEAIMEIAAAMPARKGRPRREALAALAEIRGVYVPEFHGDGQKIVKRVVADLDRCPVPLSPVVPIMNTIHDRITIEIARGCTRGCRFCQAGMVWRPVRERSQQLIEKTAASLLCSTGYDEISLLSLSSGDHSRIEPLLKSLMERYYEQRVALALPSLRVETLTRALMENIRRVRKTSFTIAPEAGTQRLRDIINKGNREEELLETTRQVFAAGWKSLKLYFMIGLPEEREEDLEGIAELACGALKQGGRNSRVAVSLSTFVPKPHTPFQWQRQIGLREIREKQDLLRKRIRNRNINVKWHDGRMSILEGLLSRGDAKTGRLIERAFRLGCRFDGWSDMLRFDLWEEAIANTGVDVEACLREKDRSEALPWKFVDCGLDDDYLAAEADRAVRGALTEDCRFTGCQACGVCDNLAVQIITAPPAAGASESAGAGQPAITETTAALQPLPDRQIKTLLMQFSKTGRARFLSHLEVSRALLRAVKKSGLGLVYSEGYHPHPRISFSSATAVGMESIDEYADIQVEMESGEQATEDRINPLLPEGLRIEKIEERSFPRGSLGGNVRGFTYDLFLPPGAGYLLPAIRQRAAEFLGAASFFTVRMIKGKAVEKDIRPLVSSISVCEDDDKLTLSVLISATGSARPAEILTEALGIGEDMAKMTRIVRTKTLFHNEPINSIDKGHYFPIE